jgi:acyl transferase domain-containing protein/acyl carrier protein
MAGRFPDAPSVEAFWQNIAEGVCSIRFFSDKELLSAGVKTAEIQNPNYVKAGTVIEDIDCFDATFFGYPPREAEILDPQHRLFLECAWEALENAAYSPANYRGSIAVFAGASFPWYLGNNVGLLLGTHPDIEELIGRFQIELNTNVDSLASRVSYKLNLSGPSVAVQTFCSTSLVAVHLACQSLLTFDCDIALAGGVHLSVPHGIGYLYQEGNILSPDGHCRAFDARAQGSVMGDGLGIVVLKRMEEALADGDQIYAVILGSAINNDGIHKVSYTAPSVNGQASVIVHALKRAGVTPDTVRYIEAHGTGTPLGDSVELSAMIKAFQRFTQRKQFCAIGSVKPNIGHLDRAAGVSSLIKATMALTHKQLPPSLNFESASPDIDLANSPFYVNTRLTDWPADGAPRRAGVSCFGIGGTNVHVILEESPEPTPSSPARPYQLLLLSAKTETALEKVTANLVAHCCLQPELNPTDVAYTLQVGRVAFNHRRALVCRDLMDAVKALEPLDSKRVLTVHNTSRDRGVAFVLPGVGDHYVGMGRELYQSAPTFRAVVDRCCDILSQYMRQDLRDVLYPDRDSNPSGEETPTLDLRALLGRERQGKVEEQPLYQTALAQPAVFVLEYALAQLLQEWGIRPQAMLGYSLGEYVAACVSGVLSLEDALRLVVQRAQLIQDLPEGGMLAVSLSEAAITPFLNAEINLALVNSPATCVVAGPVEALTALEQQLVAQGIVCRRVETRHAFHSDLLAPIAEAVTALASTMQLHPPQIPYISNVTGTWITAEQATDPGYWARHMCQTVRFEDGVRTLLQEPEQVLLEVGAGQTLGSFIKQHPLCSRERLGFVLSTLPTVHERQSDMAFLLNTIGRLWLGGVTIDWAGFYAHERRRRLSLPTYPFERQRYWVELDRQDIDAINRGARRERQADVGDWFAVTSWKRSVPASAVLAHSLLSDRHCWLLLVDECQDGARLSSWLTEHNQEVITVMPGSAFAQQSKNCYQVRPSVRADYEVLLRFLEANGQTPSQVVHTWMVTPRPAVDGTDETEEGLNSLLDRGFYSLVALTQALGDQPNLQSCRISIVSNDMQDVTSGERLCPAKATVMGLCRVIPLEYLNLTCRSIDIEWEEGAPSAQFVEQLGSELAAETEDDTVALRGAHRWVQSYVPQHIPPVEHTAARLRQRGVYLITGGLGGIGLGMAEDLAASVQARLVLVGRTGLPPREEWAQIIETQGTETGVGRRIQHVQALEARGTEVLVLQADVADEQQMREVVRQALARFGVIHGVLHAAGVPGVGLMQLKTAEVMATVLRPKVQGTLALARAVAGLELDFMVLFSSVTSANGGGPGQVDYCAANAFMDAFARRHVKAHGLTVSISWGEWLWDAWQEGLLGYSKERRKELIHNRRTYGLSFAEGAEAIRRVLSCGLPHVFVTTRDLLTMVEDMKNSTASMVAQKFQASQQAQPLYPRPVLGTAYIAPRNDVEKRVAAIWGTVLGIEQIGIDDNYFELGGNSLIGTMITVRLRQTFQARLPLTLLFTAPTVREMALSIEDILIEEIGKLTEEEMAHSG